MGTQPFKDQQLIENLVGNADNEYPKAGPCRMMINVYNELNEVCKGMLKQDLRKELIGELMEDLHEKLKDNIQKQLKEYQDGTNKMLKRNRNS
jgi:hypothetical protein